MTNQFSALFSENVNLFVFGLVSSFFACSRLDITFLLTWIPGHKDIVGNETADVAAKEPAGKQRTTGEPPRHTALKSGQITAIHKKVKPNGCMKGEAISAMQNIYDP